MDFHTLYRQICGTPPPKSQPSRPLPWNRPEEVRRIAVLRPGHLGDLLLAIPGLRALRGAFPAAEITLMALPWAVDLLDRFRWIDRILPIPAGIDGWAGPASDRHLDGFLAETQAHGYDLALQLQADAPGPARFALNLGARATAGYCRDEEIGRAFHLRLTMSPREPEILRGLRLAHALGAPPAGVQLEFPLLPRDWEEIDGLPDLHPALERRPFIAIHPGARPPARRWPLENFARLARLLHRRGATLAIVGSREEAPLTEEVLEGSSAPALNLAGRLSLGGLGALLSRVDLFIGNDSGPAQLAAATAPRSLRIFGPANRHRWAPLDGSRHRSVYREVECSPCDHWECPIDHRCLAWVTVEEVLDAAESLLGSG